MARDASDFASLPPARDRRPGHGHTTRYLEIFSFIFFVVVATLYLTSVSWTGPLPRDYTTLAVGHDFLNFWMYGRAAIEPDPGRFYDVEIYNSVLRAFAGMLLRSTGKLDTEGRRLAVLVYWLPLIQFALGQFYLPGAALIAPAFALYLVTRLKNPLSVTSSSLSAPMRS